eukprot:SAG31_NODE_4492_length_3188_cov_3.281716_3_plen_114_part_00
MNHVILTRPQLVHMDASDWVSLEQRRAAPEEFFDAILIDSTDFGASDPIHTAKFYQQLKKVNSAAFTSDLETLLLSLKTRTNDLCGEKVLKDSGALVINLTSLAWNLGCVWAS